MFSAVQQCREGWALPSRGMTGRSPETGAVAACHFLLGRPPANCTSACISLQATERAPGRYSFSNTVTGSCACMLTFGDDEELQKLSRRCSLNTKQCMQIGSDFESLQDLEWQPAVVQCCECDDCCLLMNSVPTQLQRIFSGLFCNLHQQQAQP